MALKKIDLTLEHKYVSLEDPAIDAEKSNLEQYKKSKDIKHLAFKEGEFPTIFLLKNLKKKDYSELLSKHMKVDFSKGVLMAREESNGLDMIFDAFGLGCKEIEENGQRIKITADNLSMGVVKEIAERVLEMASLSDSEKK